MPVEFETWKKGLVEFGKKEEGVLKINKHPSMGVDEDYFTANISHKYKGDDLIVSQACTKYDYCYCGPGNLKFEYNLKFEEKFHLYIYQRDFLSNFFSRKKIKTGNDTFDKAFIIESSNKTIALNLFKEEKIQKLFLSFPYLMFNIRTKNNLTSIVLKDMRHRYHAVKELHELLVVFKYIVDKITL